MSYVENVESLLGANHVAALDLIECVGAERNFLIDIAIVFIALDSVERRKTVRKVQSA